MAASQTLETTLMKLSKATAALLPHCYMMATTVVLAKGVGVALAMGLVVVGMAALVTVQTIRPKHCCFCSVHFSVQPVFMASTTLSKLCRDSSLSAKQIKLQQSFSKGDTTHVPFLFAVATHNRVPMLAIKQQIMCRQAT